MPFLTNDPLPQCLQQSSAMGASTLGGHERDVSAISLKLSVSEELKSYIPYPPMQAPESYNLEQVVKQVSEMRTSSHAGD